MGTIKNNVSGETVLLYTQHLVGRNKLISNTYLNEKDISQSHALIYWKNDSWYIEDRSRNGTIVNNDYIKNNTLKLSKGSTLQFGKDKTTIWTLVNSAAPTSYLLSKANTNKIIELWSSHVLPDTDKPEVLFYYSNEGRWKAEKDGSAFNLEHSEIYNFNNEEWQFIENDVLDETIDYSDIFTKAYFTFTLSADEEHINVKIQTGEKNWDLGERVHNYLLLALARKRLTDANKGYVFIDQGWISLEELMSDLEREFSKEIDAYYVNIQIHRLRKQLSEIEPYGKMFTNSIERRNGEIRFAHPSFQIIKEEQCIGEVAMHSM